MNRSRAFSLLAQRLLTHTIPRLTYPLGIKRILSGMEASGSRDAVFVWIPKTAGTSVWNALNKHHCPKLKDPFSVRHCFSGKGMVTFGHQSYLDLKNAGLVSTKFDRSAYKFCFVRNPFDRAVSLYAYLQKIGVFHANLSFKSFCYLLQDRAFDPIGLYNDQKLSICNPQTDWINDENGNSFVDFVGKVENVDTDFQTACDELKISCELHHSNRSVRKSYCEYYDDVTRQIIEDVYADDFANFSYHFDGNDVQTNPYRAKVDI